MLKNINGINIPKKFLSQRDNQKNYIKKQNTFLEYEISIIIKRKKRVKYPESKIKNKQKNFGTNKNQSKVRYIKNEKN